MKNSNKTHALQTGATLFLIAGLGTHLVPRALLACPFCDQGARDIIWFLVFFLVPFSLAGILLLAATSLGQRTATKDVHRKLGQRVLEVESLLRKDHPNQGGNHDFSL